MHPAHRVRGFSFDKDVQSHYRAKRAHVSLQQSREASALIRTENIIRSDIITELHELLELYCELLLARSGLLEQTPCDPGLEEAVRSIVYAAPRTDIKELNMSRALLCEKFGKEFAAEASEGKGVSERVLEKLRVEPPPQELVRMYLAEIARTYGVEWPRRPKKDDAEDGGAGDTDAADGDDGDGGGAKERPLEDPLLAEAASPPSGNVADEGKKPPVRIAPASPSTENPSPRVKLPGTQEKKAEPGTPSKPASSSMGSATAKKDVVRVGGKIPDVDELARRFAELKR